jgi:hypothetical protein
VFGLLHKFCSTNSIIKQLYKKLEFVEYPFRCSPTPPFFLELNAWSWNRLAKKRGVELKNVEQSSPNTLKNLVYEMDWMLKDLKHLIFVFVLTSI